MKKADFILIAVVLVLAGGLFLALHFGSTGGAYVSVQLDGKETQRLSLRENTRQVIHTPYGDNTLVIQDGKAFVSEADCPDKICQKHPKIYRNGESIICLPHKLVITVTNDRAADIDAVAG